MKKSSLYLLALSALTLAACSDDQPVNYRQDAKGEITFRPGMGTRASEITNANIDKFFVTAFTDTTGFATHSATKKSDNTYFSNVEFDKGQDSFFTSKGRSYYWPGENESLRFIAYSPSQDEIGGDVLPKDDGGTLSLENFTVAEDIINQVDFITADTIGSKKANEYTGVELTFNHRLSQIELQAKSDNQEMTYKIIGFRIGRFEYNGTFDFDTREWTLDDWHDTYVYEGKCDTITLTSTPQTIMGEGGNAMLLPQKFYAWDPKGDPDNVARESYLSVLVQITDNETNERIYPFQDDTMTDANGQPRQYAWATIPVGGEWLQGKKYIYTLDFTNGAGFVDPDDPNPGQPILSPIKAKVTVVDWVDSEVPTDMTPKID